jgi:predicted metalloprotease
MRIIMGAMAVVSVTAIVLVVAGCGGSKSESSASSAGPKSAAIGASASGAPLDTSDVKITGDADNPVNQDAITAIASLQQFWADQYPKVYGQDYKPVAGGFFGLTQGVEGGSACGKAYADVQGNAFYCPTDDTVTWDAGDFLATEKKKFGDFVVAVVLAHEFGHAIQARSGFFEQNKLTVSSELQADCFAGAWSKYAKDSGAFNVNAAQLDSALAGVLDLRDQPGSSAEDPNAHGSGFDRVGAFQDGFDGGAEKCKGYKDGEPMVLELPFKDTQDEANGGDAPYDSIVNGVPYDLEDYWTQVYPEITGGKPWTPLKGLEPFDPANPPDCGGSKTEGYSLFYCVPDDYIGWDNVTEMPEVYADGGDYAVATLLATQYGLAALNRLDDKSDEKTSTLRADCFAGAYTASVILYNRQATSTFHISPGDLDEGITALLIYRGDGDVERQGAGYGRVRAFREGVINGAQPCTTLEP